MDGADFITRRVHEGGGLPMLYQEHLAGRGASAFGVGAALLVLYVSIALFSTTIGRVVVGLLNVGSLIGLAAAPCLSLYLTFRYTRPWFTGGSGYWERVVAAAVGSLVFSVGLSIAVGMALIALVYLESAWRLFAS
jgi:hypothetical protein